MITAYHRPQSLDEALALLSRRTPSTVPLGGGTLLSHGQAEAIEVVDLQALGLNYIHNQGGNLQVGATTTLQSLSEDPNVSAALQLALKLEAPVNLRDAATVAGTIVVCDGRSSLVAALLALDAKLTLMKPGVENLGIGDFLALRSRRRNGTLITQIEFPLNAALAFEYVSRTPADKPIVCVALAQWPSSRTRLAVGGYGPSPLLALDGTEAGGLAAAARNALHDASDPWGSAEYRMDVAATLVERCLTRLQS